MISNNDERSCCGCGACIDVCTQKCVTMAETSLGAKFARIETARCISCGKCEQVCPMRNTSKSETPFPKEAFAAFASDPALRSEGASGGIASVISKELFQAGYCVYGAAFDERLKLKHIRADNLDDLRRMAKSKYLQSDMQGVYNDALTKLKAGYSVLFIGTPCQNHAMKNYIPQKYREKLVLVDIFCHGVPSQRFFDECLEYEDAASGVKTVGFTFRVKPKNPSSPHYYERVTEKNGKIKKTTRLYFNSVFYAAFQKYIILRESCYQCRFAGEDRASDLTIGDFHEVDEYISGVDRFRGISRIIINTQKGKDILTQLQGALWMQEIDLRLLDQNGHGFGQITSRPALRDEFVRQYEMGGIAALAREPLNRNKYLLQNVYYHLPRPVRKTLMHIFRRR